LGKIVQELFTPLEGFFDPEPIEILLKIFSGYTPKFINQSISLIYYGGINVLNMIDAMLDSLLLICSQRMVFYFTIYGKAFIASVRICA